MSTKRLAAVAVTAMACFFASSTMAAVPSPATMPSPAPRLVPSGHLNLSAVDVPEAHMSRAAATDMLLTLAWSLRGIAYRWGGHSPSTGFDCSGLVRYVYRHALGVDLPHRARLQYDHGKRIARNELEPGDLVFFRTHGRSISHVGIYLDHGRFLNAPTSGEVVKVSSLDNPYWSRHYAGARRLHDLVQS